MLKISIEDAGFMQRLSGFVLRAEKIGREPMREIGNTMKSSQLKTFESEGRPSQWTPSRAALDEGRKTLWKSGKLAKSSTISELTEHSVEVLTGENLPYTKFVRFGTQSQIPSARQRAFFWAKFYETQRPTWKFMALAKILRGLPARKFSQFQDEDVIKINNILRRYILVGGSQYDISIN